MMLTREDILKTLEAVSDRESGMNVVQAGMISGVTVRSDGHVGFLITIAPDKAKEKAWLQSACEQVVAKMQGVTRVSAVLTAEVQLDYSLTRLPDNANRLGSSDHRIIEQSSRRAAQWNREPLAHVRRLIAVASGKGGVGKSTTAVNLAHGLASQGRRIGLLDADIYGPSIPRMMGLKEKPEVEGNTIIPPQAHGIACMSMGLLVGEESALVWRGPQMSKALHQLLRGVVWGTAAAPLDTLLIDMPPGTGDIHLSLAQQAPLDGVVIVTTPQDVAVADARKCIDMFRKVNVPILGVIENMSGFSDPVTGKVHAIFGSGGGQILAKTQGLPFLGAIPIMIALREASDNGIRFEGTHIYNTIAAGL